MYIIGVYILYMGEYLISSWTLHTIYHIRSMHRPKNLMRTESWGLSQKIGELTTKKWITEAILSKMLDLQNKHVGLYIEI